MGDALAGAILKLGPVQFWMLAGGAVCASLGGLHATFRYLIRARILEDVPTARVRSAAQGYTELQGTSRLLDGPAIVAPLTHTPCTWWSYEIAERTHERNNRWRTLSKATSEALFALDDDSGRCIVDPDGAEVYPMLTRRWYGDSATPPRPRPSRRFGAGRYRYTEKRIHAGDPLYAIGEFRTCYPGARFDADREVRELLRAWKRDRAALLQRFDANRDGEIDLREWERARRAAREQILDQQRQLEAAPGVSILAAAQDGRPFLLGALPQPDLGRRLRRRALAAVLTFVLGLVVAGVLLASRFG